MEFLTEYGYLGMFASAFLAATILPLSSEVVLGFLLSQGFDPNTIVLVAATGNVLGSVVNYGLGFLGSTLIFKKVLRLSDIDIDLSKKRFQKYGSASLLFAWVPVIGDPLTVAAGILKVNFFVFLLLVGIGKTVRYLFLTWAILAI
jgi:membrane protein YqaA with SNARE-associated domain